MYQGSLSTVSNRADWTQTVAVEDDDGTAVDLSDAEITLEVRERKDRGCATRLSATVDDGITVDADNGTFTWTFDRDDLEQLEGTYDVGCIITIDDVTTQLFVGTVAIIDGVVS